MGKGVGFGSREVDEENDIQTAGEAGPGLGQGQNKSEIRKFLQGAEWMWFRVGMCGFEDVGTPVGRDRARGLVARGVVESSFYFI